MKTSGSSPTLEMENPRLRNARKGKTVRPHICFHRALAAALLALETSRQTSPTRGFEKKFFPGLEPIYGRQAQQSPSLIYEFLLLSQSYGFVGLAHTYCGVICYVVNLSL